MSHYYEENDLERFDELGKYRPDLYDIFMNYYQGVMSAGALSVREKALIALAVAHAVQCPYCIDAYTRGSLEAGSNLEEMTEAIHVAAAIRGGAACSRPGDCSACLRPTTPYRPAKHRDGAPV